MIERGGVPLARRVLAALSRNPGAVSLDAALELARASRAVAQSVAADAPRRIVVTSHQQLRDAPAHETADARAVLPQQQPLSAPLMQLVVSAAAHAPRSAFIQHRQELRALLVAAADGEPGSVGAATAMTLQRYGRLMFASLMVRHDDAPRDVRELLAICGERQRVPQSRPVRAESGELLLPLRLPLHTNVSVGASWKHATAVVSWASRFAEQAVAVESSRIGDARLHVASRDVVHALAATARQVPHDLPGHATLIERLGALLAASREVELRSPALNVAAGAGARWATARVVGRTIVFSGNESSEPLSEAPVADDAEDAEPALPTYSRAAGRTTSDLLLRGMWRDALGALAARFDAERQRGFADVRRLVPRGGKPPPQVPLQLVKMDAKSGLRFLWRNPQREDAPYACAAAVASGDEAVIRDFCRAAAEQLVVPHPRYASQFDATLQTVITMASLTHLGTAAMRRCVRALFSAFASEAARLESRRGASPTERTPSDLADDVGGENEGDGGGAGALFDTLGNLHRSLLVEAVATVGPCVRALEVLGRGSSAAPTMLSLEAASALLIGCVVEGLDDAAVSRALGGADAIDIVFPHDLQPGTIPGAAPLFTSGVLRDLAKTVVDTVAPRRGWRGVAALLAARSRRIVTPLPMVTGPAGGPLPEEPLKLRVVAVPVLATLRRLRQQSQRLSHGDVAVAAPCLPLADATSALALYKAAGVASTVHGSVPSVVGYLGAHSSSLWSSPESAVSDADETTPSTLAQRGLLNRLDISTSGVLLAARDFHSLHAMRRNALAERSHTKVYFALVARNVASTSATALPFLEPEGFVADRVFIDGRGAERGGDANAAVGVDCRDALSAYRVLEHFPRRNVWFVRVVLTAGRRHQIRQHFAAIGFPLVEDKRYGYEAGANKRLMSRVALHAAEVVVPGGTDGGAVVVAANLPDDFQRALQQLRREKSRDAAELTH